MGVERFNQEHKTHSAYHDPRVSGRVPGESWRALEGLGGFRDILEAPGESGNGSGTVLESLGGVPRGFWRSTGKGPEWSGPIWSKISSLACIKKSLRVAIDVVLHQWKEAANENS